MGKTASPNRLSRLRAVLVGAVVACATCAFASPALAAGPVYPIEPRFAGAVIESSGLSDPVGLGFPAPWQAYSGIDYTSAGNLQIQNPAASITATSWAGYAWVEVVNSYQFADNTRGAGYVKVQNYPVGLGSPGPSPTAVGGLLRIETPYSASPSQGFVGGPFDTSWRVKPQTKDRVLVVWVCTYDPGGAGSYHYTGRVWQALEYGYTALADEVLEGDGTGAPAPYLLYRTSAVQVYGYADPPSGTDTQTPTQKVAGVVSGGGWSSDTEYIEAMESVLETTTTPAWVDGGGDALGLNNDSGIPLPGWMERALDWILGKVEYLAGRLGDWLWPLRDLEGMTDPYTGGQ